MVAAVAGGGAGAVRRMGRSVVASEGDVVSKVVAAVAGRLGS